MKVEIDSFSGGKIYPGRVCVILKYKLAKRLCKMLCCNDIRYNTNKGKLFVRGDSKVFRFQSSKAESLFKQRKNPRRVSWTVLYRRQHRKGITEEVAKKRTRRVVKHQRAVVGASLEVIKEKRSIRPETRQAARAQAIKNAKEKKKEAESKKRAERAKKPVQKVVSKQQAKGAPVRVAASSR